MIPEPTHAEELRPADSRLPGTPSGTETVLVVEDEEPVRRLIRQILELNGYTVLEACDGAEASAISERYDKTIDLLLTDLDMPDMSGRELAQRLRTSRSGMKLLYMSGRDGSDILGYGVFPAGTIFLPKPFTPYGLAWKVHEVLAPASDY